MRRNLRGFLLYFFLYLEAPPARGRDADARMYVGSKIDVVSRWIIKRRLRSLCDPPAKTRQLHTNQAADRLIIYYQALIFFFFSRWSVQNPPPDQPVFCLSQSIRNKSNMTLICVLLEHPDVNWPPRSSASFALFYNTNLGTFSKLEKKIITP